MQATVKTTRSDPTGQRDRSKEDRTAQAEHQRDRGALVVGQSRALCQTFVLWLRDLGSPRAWRIQDFTTDADPDADVVVILVQNAEDVGAASGWLDAYGVRASVVILVIAEASWTLLTTVLQRDGVASRLHGVVVLPVAGDLLMKLLDQRPHAGPVTRPPVVLPGDMMDAMPVLAMATEVQEAPPSGLVLTPREREILLLLDRHYSNEEIARLLVISPHTVKRHLEHLFDKLAVNSRHDAVRVAHRWGLLKTRRTDRLHGQLGLNGNLSGLTATPVDLQA